MHTSWPATPADVGAQTGTATIVNTGQTDYQKVSGSPGSGQSVDDVTRVMPFMDWGNDVLVGASVATPTWGKLSTDVASNGDIYVGLLDPTSDTAYVWRSTNGGSTWAYWSRNTGGPTTGGISDFVLRVGSDAGGDWVYTFDLYDGATTDGGLWVRRMRPDLSSGTWTHIVTRGDTIIRISADRNTEDPQYLFASIEATPSGNCYMWSSNDASLTWTNQTYVASGRRQFSIAAGGDHYVYCVYFDNTDSTYIRTGRHTNNLNSGGTWTFTNVDQLTDNRFREASIAADRLAAGASQTAIILDVYKYVPNGNIGPRYAWSQTGGASWSASFWPVTNQVRSTWDFRHPYIRRSYGSELFRAVVTGDEPTTNWDTLFYAFSRPTSPTTWEDRATPNDHRITGEYAGQVDYSSALNGGYVTYREYALNNIWFDGWNWTGVSEKPGAAKPGTGMTTLVGREGTLNLSLPAAARVRATLLDGTGRFAGTVFDGRLDAGEHRLPIRTANLTQGIYFLSLDINGRTHTTKLVHVQ
jgi:hypothetical protein